MYHLIDRSVSDLGQPERLILLSIREWALATRRGRCPVDAVTLRFLSHGLVGGLEPFCMAMALAARHGTMRLEIGCPCAPRVTEGEALLLSGLLPRPDSEAQWRESLVGRETRLQFCRALADLDAALMLAGLV